MDLVSLVNAFATGTYTVTRRASGGFTRGMANPTVNNQFSVKASVQPAGGKDLLRLPEGRRTNETRVVVTTTELYTGDQGLTFEADLILIDNEEWEVQHVEDWVDSLTGNKAFYCIAQAPTPESTP